MIYYGFFDAAFDETTGKYDRTYNGEDFTGYFENFIGSGVCVYNNPDSMKVSASGTDAIIASGYLFINGYWLKNDSDYTISFSGIGDGVYAVYAKLNLGARMIEVGQMAKADSYTDALVLAYVTVSGGALSVEDTRYNADICGVIDAVGSLSSKIEYAFNYIDTEIESKLQQIEQDLQNQSDIINSKLDEANALIAKISPPPIGTVKFSASSTIEEGWLRCDGSFVSETDYPELVAALGKLIPSGDKFKLISDGEIGTSISNGVLHDGRMWVYSWATQKLYGVDVDGEQPIKEIAVTCDDQYFPLMKDPNKNMPIALSIVSDLQGGYKLFLGQIIGDGEGGYTSGEINTDIPQDVFLFYSCDMDSSAETLALTRPFTKVNGQEDNLEEVKAISNFCNSKAIPYVVSEYSTEGTVYYVATYSGGTTGSSIAADTLRVVYVSWIEGQTAQKLLPYIRFGGTVSHTPRTWSNLTLSLPCGFSHKNQNKFVTVSEAAITEGTWEGNFNCIIESFEENIFPEKDLSKTGNSGRSDELQSDKPSMAIISNEYLVIPYLANGKVLRLSIGGVYHELDETSLSQISLPSNARGFVDSSCYLWGKDIFFIFVGTGIIFTRNPTSTSSFGYLDTTSVMGQITQGGYMDYSQDEGTLYIMGQDTANKVKCAKIVLNTLYDYANDGAWLPLIASDGVPAWIKAKEVE